MNSQPEFYFKSNGKTLSLNDYMNSKHISKPETNEKRTKKPKKPSTYSFIGSGDLLEKTFCIKDKEPTFNKDKKGDFYKSAAGRYMVKGICSQCKSKKSNIIGDKLVPAKLDKNKVVPN